MDRGLDMAGDCEPSPKRRKVRKGTQSCWQCKRRKIRCTTFAANGADSSSGVVCDGCRSRNTRCIGQEYDEQDMTTRAKTGQQAHRDIPPTNTSVPVAPTPVYSSLKDISRVLAAAWPSEHDLEGLLDACKGVSVLFHGVICQPYPQLLELLGSSNFSSKQILHLPPNATSKHPVLIARRLLLLANFIQDLPPRSVNQDRQNGEEMIQILTTTVSNLVTSKDELAGSSLEGIECVMLESMHLINAGQFRRAWMTNRRAMLMAQLSGLHLHKQAAVKGSKNDRRSTGRMRAPRTLEATTSERINPAIMWFRLNANDIFLSLLLGLPPETSIISSPVNLDERPSYATREELRVCSPLERLERAITLVGGYILHRQSRRQRSFSSPEAISELVACDEILLEGASHMPPQWWALVPGDSPECRLPRDGKPKMSTARLEVEHTLRMMAHFAYYHVLIQLHLPYMLLDGGQEANFQVVTDRSRATAANASRTIANQYIAFFRNQGKRKPAYCRGVDFVAFVACVTLSVHTNKSQSLLRHQQLADRGLLDRVVAILEDMAALSRGDDVAADKMAKLLKQLLAVHDQAEEKHKQGWSLCFRLEAEEQDEDDPSAAAADVAQGLAVRINIPHVGTIVIESLPSDLAHMAPRRQSPELVLDNTGIFPPLPTDFNENMARDDWALQGVDMALFSSLAQGMFGETDIEAAFS